jgi:hypothetical protein
VPLVCVSLSVDNGFKLQKQREGAISLLPIYFMEAIGSIYAMLACLFIGWWKVTGKHLD